MSHDINRSCTIFVVETNKYSGNFEKEMVAYMTGFIGNCGVGLDEMVTARREWKSSRGLPPAPEVVDLEDEEEEDDIDVGYREEDEEEDEEESYIEEDEAIFGLPVPLEFGEWCRPATTWSVNGRTSGVAVAFEALTSENIEVLKNRAQTYCTSLGSGILITGIRVLRREVRTEDSPVYEEAM